MKMKVLIVGGQQIWAIENYYQRYMSQEGAFVEIFPIHDLFYQKIRNNIFYRVVNRLGYTAIYHSVNQQLKEKINSFCPNIVWVFKGMEVQVETLEWIKSKNIKLVNYNPDHPFLFSSRGSGNKNVVNGVGFYDLHFCYHTDVMKIIDAKYGISCAHLPFGFDLSEAEYINVANESEIKRICFIGNPDKIREKFIQDLLKAELSIDVYGNDWEKTNLGTYKNIKIFPPIYPPTFWLIAHKYRLHINIFREHNVGSHNMRTFEIPAAGSIMLATDSIEHRLFFEHEKEAFFYKTTEEAIFYAHKILNLSEEAAMNIRNNARKRSTEAFYSYKDRAKFVLHTFKSEFNYA